MPGSGYANKEVDVVLHRAGLVFGMFKPLGSSPAVSGALIIEQDIHVNLLRSTQAFITLGSINRVTATAGVMAEMSSPSSGR